MRRSTINTAPVNEAILAVHDTLRSPGQRLDAATRAFFEPFFGHDFSQVRVHTDTRAAESARAVNALAYTVGRDVVLGGGQYNAGGLADRRLLAHELAHVVQQAHPGVQAFPLAISQPEDPEEQAAQRIAAEVVGERNESATGQAPPGLWGERTAPIVQRQEVGEERGLRLQPPALIAESVDLTVDGFATNAAELGSAQKDRLAAFAGVILSNLPRYGNSFVTITGHTDAVGSEALNKELGQRRAEAVRAFLIAQKVPPDIVHTYSMGKGMLRVLTRRAEGRNRRAEISLTLREGIGAGAVSRGKSTLRIPLPPVTKQDTVKIKKVLEGQKKPPQEQTKPPQEQQPIRDAKEERDKPRLGGQVGTGGQFNVLEPRQPVMYLQITGEYSDAFASSFEREELPVWLRKHLSSLKFIGEPGLTLQFHYMGDAVATFDLQFLFKLIQASLDKVGDLSLVGGGAYTDIFSKPKAVKFTPLVGAEGERKIAGSRLSVVIDMLLGAQAVDVPQTVPGAMRREAEQTRKLNVQFSAELRLSF
jgi:outer membrane protein OmpA-like peptidoglycan-associated protein